MILTEEDKKMYGGEYGAGVQKAISFLIEYGEAFDAKQLVKVESAHILPDPVHMLQELTEELDQVRVMATLHSGSPLGSKWVSELGLRTDCAGPVIDDANKALEIYKKHGCFMTMSCAPYTMGNVLKKGNVFSWAGSSGIIINNSVFGARGNRDSGLAMTASAITGRTPEIGRIRNEERYGEILVRFQKVDVNNLSQADLGAIGYFIGNIAQTKNVVIDGLPDTIPFEHLKYLLSPMPVSGAVSLCHIVGITPEAPSVEATLGGRKPEMEVTVSPKEIVEAVSLLNAYKTNDVDVVMLGCPHLTIREIKEVALLLSEKRISENTRLFLATNEGVYNLAKRMGYLDIIQQAGGLVITDSCIAVFPFANIKIPVTNVATNSSRCAHYLLRGGAGEIVGGKVMQTFHGDTVQCINAAINGKWEEK